MKIQKKHIFSIIAIFLLVPALFLTIAEIRGDGFGFTALYGRYKTEQCLSNIVKGNFERAAEQMSFSKIFFTENINEEQAREKWISGMQSLKNEGFEIVSYGSIDIYTDDAFTSGNVDVTVKINNNVYPCKLSVFIIKGQVEFGGLNRKKINPKPEDKDFLLVAKMNDIIGTYFAG